MTSPLPTSPREREFQALVTARGLRPFGPSHLDKTLRQLAAFFTRALLREQVARRPGLLQGTDPRVRLLATLFFLVSVSLAQSIPALLFSAVMPLVALTLSRIRAREFFASGFGITLLFSLLMAAPATLNLVVSGEVLLTLVTLPHEWRFGPYLIPAVIGISREGLLTVATFLLRVLTSVAAVLWLTLSTPWMELLRSLRSVGLPALVVQVVGMAVRYLFAFRQHAEETYLGKKSRSVCRAPLASERAWVAARLAHSWESSLHLMAEVSEAMTARGFTGEARLTRGVRFRRRDWLLLLGTAGGCLAAHML
jgi:cobalt/nickel transport system permease protein